MHRPRSLLIAGLFLSASLIPPALAQSSDDTMLILDASGSMWGLVEGQTKMTIARQSLATIVAKLKDSDRIGLMAYGHRQRGDCKDIEVLIPSGPLDAGRFKAEVDKIVPKGMTPLSESLRAAARALRATERKATVILISDGIETCGADPCAVAAELKKAGVGFTAHVIGFDVADPLAKRQLQCIARNTGGIYLDAGNAGALDSALGKAVAATQGGKVASEAPAKEPEDPLKGLNLRAQARLAAGLDPIADPNLAWALHKPGPGGEPGDPVQTEYKPRLAIAAPPGRYVLVVTYGEVTRSFPVVVERGKPTNVDAVLDAGFVVSDGTIAGSNAKADNVTWQLIRPDGDVVTTNYDAVPRFIVPAGKYVLKLSKGTASATKAFELAAGDSINLPLTLEVGRLQVTGFYAPGGPPVKDGFSVEVRHPSANDGEKGEWVATQYDAQSNFDMAAGTYDVVASVGRASVTQRVEIKPGAVSRMAITLNAGVAGIKAPGSSAIEVWGAERDINNQRQWIETGYDGALNVALPAGEYVAIAEFDGAKTERPFTVAAGKRVEVEVKR